MIKKVKKGFTLIELVVVIAVIAILSAVSVVAYVGITNSAKKSSASQKAAQIVTAIRAAALTSDKGYTEQDRGTDKAALEAGAYTVTIDGKKLTFKVGETEVTSAADQLKVINDMMDELEGSGVHADEYKEVGSVSKIGVKPSDSLAMEYAEF